MPVRITDLSINLGGKEVLSHLSLTMPERGVVSIFGPSGSGKTTLFNCLSGLLLPDSGSIEGMSDKKISMVFQENRLLPWFSAIKNVSFVLNGDEERARWALEQMELAEAMNKLPHELSGGMQRRVSIARALAYGGDILLLDEPTTGLDEQLADRLMRRVLQQWQDKLVLLITHDSNIVEKFADYRYDLNVI